MSAIPAPNLQPSSQRSALLHTQGLRLAVAMILLVAGWRYAMQFAAFSNGVEADLYPSWYAAKQVFVEHRNPYSQKAALAIQRGIYGRTVPQGGTPMRDEQRFVYPLFGIFAMAPLAWLSFAAAQKLVFWIFIILAVAGTCLWARAMQVRCTPVMLALVMATFPITSGIVVRQPSVLYLFFLAFAAWAAKKDRFILAGAAAAFATAKPQLAVVVLVPLLFWTIADWPRRRRIVYSFAVTLALLLGAAFLLQPHWFAEWLSTVAAYRAYTDTKAVLGLTAPVFAVSGVILLWRERRELDFTIALSAAAACLVVPLQTYDLAVLLPAALWIWRERKELLQRRFSRTAYQLAAFMFSASMASLVLVSVLPAGPLLFSLPWRMFTGVGVLAPVLLLLHRYVARSSQPFRGAEQAAKPAGEDTRDHECTGARIGTVHGGAA
jgi:glycosyl transferase family 87